MSLLHRTDVYQGSNEKADLTHSGYGFVLALICMALALVVASVMFTRTWIGVGTGTSTTALAASTISPLEMMMTVKDLPNSHYDDYSVVFN
jgi:hypothetical protein